MNHKTPLKSSTNLVFISRFNPIIDSSKVGCCSDEVHVVVGVVILRSGDGGKVSGYFMHACCAHELALWVCMYKR